MIDMWVIIPCTSDTAGAGFGTDPILGKLIPELSGGAHVPVMLLPMHCLHLPSG